MLGFNDTSTLVGHYVSSPREREKRDRRDSRGDKKRGTGKKKEREAVLTNTHNLYFEQEYENYHIFLSENFPFLVVKFSIYLNRRVFVMIRLITKVHLIFMSGSSWPIV